MAAQDVFSELIFDKEGPLCAYCECANRIRFGSPEDSELAQSQLDNLYEDLTTVAFSIPDKATVDVSKTSTAWLAACYTYLAGRPKKAEGWAAFVELDQEYSWISSLNIRQKILARSAMQSILGNESGYLHVRNAWSLSSHFEPKYLSMSDKRWIYIDLHDGTTSTMLYILGSVYLSVLDMYEHLMWGEAPKYRLSSTLSEQSKDDLWAQLWSDCYGANDM